VSRDRQPVGPTRREYFVLVDERMNLDLVGHQRLACKLNGLLSKDVVKFATPTCLARPSRFGISDTRQTK
jgi:hypothetical protein